MAMPGIPLLFEFCLDRIPEAIRGVDNGEQLAGSFRDGFKIREEGPAERAILYMGMGGSVHTRADHLRHLGLELLTGHIFQVFGHRRPSLRGNVRMASRSFKRALCSCDLLLPMEQSSIAAISLCS